jgi:hypothetical protein
LTSAPSTSASTERSFTITNTGCTPFAGSVSAPCEDYAVTTGAGEYELVPGQPRVVTIRFTPTGCGTKGCIVDTGNGICSDVSCTGTGGGTICSVSPTSLDFGIVMPGQSEERSFTITNTGCTTITGLIGEDCADYSIIQGLGPFSLPRV